MTSLPVVTCTDCGACCRHVGSPPGYALFFPAAQEGWPAVVQEALWETEDGRRLRAMPEALRAGLRAYYERCELTGDWRDGRPCCWYDEATRQCRNYFWRPEICRAFEVGSQECLEFRKECGIV